MDSTPARSFTARSTLVFALLGASLSGCGGGGLTSLTFQPASAKTAAEGTTTEHFVYEGGCFDFDLPAGWAPAKVKGDHVSKFRDMNMKTRTVGLMRHEMPKGTDVKTYATQWIQHRMEYLNKKEAKAEAATGETVNEPMTWDTAALVPVALGAEPQQRDALSYSFGYTALKVTEDRGSFGERYQAMRHGFTLPTKTEVQVGATQIHQYFFIADGNAWFNIVFNARSEDWTAFAPILQSIVASFRFGQCG
ncbi:MAG: hypothetical protein ACHREM_06800 [Polyangiales bacterium]